MNSADSNRRPQVRDETHPTTTQKSYSFGQLSGGTKEIIIVNEGAQYRLRLTRNGKLILTK